ncbi:hypothetical protein L195_g003447 [Trifolium pratense]|uniref:Uncharacterized protein n=1 Tax=Trifolium pratense TaxID=57577 RepID=A0A2K3NV97_TRIPR|nr:hypothetical protein L195_g003447 [Trifolium pratense]
MEQYLAKKSTEAKVVRVGIDAVLGTPLLLVGMAAFADWDEANTIVWDMGNEEWVAEPKVVDAFTNFKAVHVEIDQ